MEKREYEASYQLESSFWWFKGQREILIDSIKQSQSTISGPILDAGCGTGKNLETITKILSPHSVGFDILEWTLPFLQQRDLTNRACQPSIDDIPFPDVHFEISIRLGGFECEEVNERASF